MSATEQQRRAAEARDLDILLEAGAGTGKTRVLVDRFCGAVDADGAQPDQLLAITFTEKAAGELKQRVRRELARLGQHEAARSVEAGWLSTIHGFCRRLLASHPIAAGLDPAFRVLDADEAERVARRAFDRALEDLLSGDDAEPARVAAAYGLPRLRTLIEAAHDDLRSRGLEPVLPEAAPAGGTRDDDAAYATLRRLLGLHGHRYRELKAERSALDFTDLELRALRLLEENESLREEWRARFTHVLVDEMQDTSPLQARLARALRGEDTRLFLVGDEFQSIYAFRRADLEAFRRERDAIASSGSGEVMPLTGNFRSVPEVLATVNGIGAALLEGFRPLVAGVGADEPTPGDGPAVELLLTAQSKEWTEPGVGLELDPGSPSQGYRHAEARFLARRLRALVDSGVERSSIVVLLRALTHVRAYDEALERFGLAPYVVGGRGYWSHQQVEDARQLLGVIANPLDDVSLLGALSCPACGVSADALWLLRRMAGEEREREPIWPVLAARYGSGPDPNDGGNAEGARYAEQMPAADADRLREFVARVQKLRAEAPRLGLEELVERALANFDYDLASLTRRGGARRMANLRKLMRVAREFEQHEGRDLRAFLDYVDSRDPREDRESEAATEAEQHDGVRVMTVHNAKGLEFDVVAVADLGRKLGGGGTPAIRLAAEPPANGDDPAVRVGLRLARLGREAEPVYDWEELEKRAQAEDEAEELRLAYVAASRARHRLILSGCCDLDAAPPAEPDRKRPIIDRLIRGLEVPLTGGAAHLAAPEALEGVEPRRAPVELPVRLNPAAPGAGEDLNGAATEAPEPVPLPGGAVTLRDPVAVAEPPLAQLSYSALADYDRCPYRFYVERVLGLRAPAPRAAVAEDDDDAPLARELRYGLGGAVHELLEWSSRNLWASPDPDRVERTLRRAGLEPDAALAERAAAMTGRWLDSGLCAGLRETDAATRAEVPFLLALGGAVLRGSIDLLGGPREGEALVVDYKTDSLDGRDAASLVEVDYRRQRDLYALAAAAAGGGRVRTVYFFCDEGGGPVERAYGSAELEAARTELEGVIGLVSAGRFDPSPEPHLRLCAGCPAQERLCSHGKEMTTRPSPA